MNRDDVTEHIAEQRKEAAAVHGRDLAAHIFETASAMNRAVAAQYVPVAERPITPADLYALAGKEWMPAAAKEALVRAARTIAALEPHAAKTIAALERAK